MYVCMYVAQIAKFVLSVLKTPIVTSNPPYAASDDLLLCINNLYSPSGPQALMSLCINI